MRYYSALVNIEEVVTVLRAERERRSVSQRALAERLGMSDNKGVQKLERPGSNPTLRSVQRYAAALGVELKVEVESVRTVAFFNHAGGVAKTSSVRDIGFILAEQGFKVLVIDADPQANLSEWLGLLEPAALEQTIFNAVISGGRERSELQLPPPLRVHNLDLIPSQLDLARIDLLLPGELNGLMRLRNAIRKLEGYDFVLIDPPPSLGQLSALCVIAADFVVVPLPTNSKGLRGIQTVIKMVESYREMSPRLKIAMFLLTQFDARTRHDQDSLEAIRIQLPEVAAVSSPLRHRPATYKDAQIAGAPIPAFKPNDVASEEIRTVTSELLEALQVKVSL